MGRGTERQVGLDALWGEHRCSRGWDGQEGLAPGHRRGPVELTADQSKPPLRKTPPSSWYRLREGAAHRGEAVSLHSGSLRWGPVQEG